MALKLEPFCFAVYDANLRRHTVDSTGLHLDQGAHPWWSVMWIYCDHEVPNLRTEKTLVSYPHLPAHVALDFTHPEDLPHQIGAIFCAFVQGVVLGWNTVKHDLNVRGEVRDDINIADYIPEPERPNLGDKLGVGIRQWRALCRTDVIAFAVKEYEEKGASHLWSIDDFQKSGFARLPYPLTTIRGVVGDLSQEGVLGGTFGPMCVLDAQEYRMGAPGTVEEFAKRWVEHVRSVGEKEGWLVQTDEPSNQDRPDQTVGAVPKIFIIHGHDKASRMELVSLLESELQVRTVVMKERAGMSRTFIEKFEQEAKPCDAAIAILTPDDLVRVESEEYQQARPNVLYELGWFSGKLGRHRTLMLVKEGTSIPSDLYGIQQVRFREELSEKYLELKREIEAWKHPQG
ncbi:MAG TPA: nucleotide-binding protein [Phycisphaerae bacterium]|nr:nucleotide-binding protein [Phycisphaerae bacterium]